MLGILAGALAYYVWDVSLLWACVIGILVHLIFSDDD